MVLKIAGPGSGLFLTPGGQAPFGFQIKQGIRESPEQDWALAGGALLGPAAAPGKEEPLGRPERLLESPVNGGIWAKEF